MEYGMKTPAVLLLMMIANMRGQGDVAPEQKGRRSLQICRRSDAAPVQVASSVYHRIMPASDYCFAGPLLRLRRAV